MLRNKGKLAEGKMGVGLGKGCEFQIISAEKIEAVNLINQMGLDRSWLSPIFPIPSLHLKLDIIAWFKVVRENQCRQGIELWGEIIATRYPLSSAACVEGRQDQSIQQKVSREQDHKSTDLEYAVQTLRGEDSTDWEECRIPWSEVLWGRRLRLRMSRFRNPQTAK